MYFPGDAHLAGGKKVMIGEQARAAATKLMTQLPPMPEPWGVDKLCERLAEQRGRELVVYPADLPALPFGLWYNDGERDYVIYRTGIRGYHRDHIILHEICHMLARHNTVAQPLDGGEDSNADVVSRLVENAMRNSFNSLQEETAEMFASKVLELARQSKVTELSGFERRAAAAFGAS
ncbi:MAG: hypothetical protein ACRDQX_05205 [Pseudonocardiaceae bacterium]